MPGPQHHSLVACSLLMAAMALFSRADEPGQDAFTAQDVLDRMAKVYARCKTYRDSGVVKTTFIRAGGSQTVEKPFATAFVRPNRFRFEYRDRQRDGQERRYIVWGNGREVQTWWDVQPGVEKMDSLGLALAGATGVSGSSAHTIPALLLPKEAGGRRLTEMTEVKRVEDAMFDKVDCFRVEGKFSVSSMTIWIDRKTFLVRRIDSRMRLEAFRSEDTTTYNPAVNEEIPDKDLEFDAPKAK